MIDLKQLRDDPDRVRESQRTRGEDPGLVDRLLQADQARREAISAADAARAEHKAYTKSMGKKMRDASPEEKERLRARGTELSTVVKEKEEAQRRAEASVHDLQMQISNIVEGAPAGGEEDFVVLEKVGKCRDRVFTSSRARARCCSSACCSSRHKRPCSTGLNS